MRKHHLAFQEDRGYLQGVSVHAAFPTPERSVRFMDSCVD